MLAATPPSTAREYTFGASTTVPDGSTASNIGSTAGGTTWTRLGTGLVCRCTDEQCRRHGDERCTRCEDRSDDQPRSELRRHRSHRVPLGRPGSNQYRM